MATDQRIAVTCANCGAIRYKAPWYVRKCTRHFCDAKCHGEWLTQNRRGKDNPQYQRVTVQCAECGKEIERKAYKLKRSERFFCSMECRGKWHTKHLIGPNNPTWNRIAIPCDGCGKDIQAIPYRLENHDKHFCNKACYGVWQSQNKVGENHPNWKGGYEEYYGPNWNAQRRAARQRDNYRCQHCKITEHKLGKELDVHHVVPFRTFGYIQGENERYKEANRLDNLISLCPSCHQFAERGNLSVQLKLL